MGVFERLKTDLEQEAANLLVEYHDQLMCEAMRLCRDHRVVAEDLVMNTLEEYLRGKDRFDPAKGSLIDYLKGIQLRLHNHLARGKMRSSVVYLDPDDLEGIAGAVEEIDPAKLSEAQSEAEVVRQAMDQLSPDVRRVLALRYFEDFSVREIARVLKISEDSAKSRLYYARKAMAGILARQAKKPMVVILALLLSATTLFGAWKAVETVFSEPNQNEQQTQTMNLKSVKTLATAATAAVMLGASAETTSVERKWTGKGNGTYWEDPENWDPVGVPAEGDTVSIPAWKNVSMVEPSAPIASLQIYGGSVLTCSGWMTKLSAQTVLVEASATITCARCKPTDGLTNRVWIACQDLNVKGNGKIDVSGKGFDCNTAGGVGRGPGGGTTGGGGAHGGFGGWAWSDVNLAARGYNALPNDDAEDPELPGSSGHSTKYYSNGYGGGVVRIEATGTVTVNGTISADAPAVASQGNGGGAGGTVNITCSAITGSGTISAKGGDSLSCDGTGSLGAPGGGGRIAIHYDPAVQTGEQAKNLTISAAAGRVGPAGGSYLPVVRQDAYYATGSTPAGLGTLWFTDDKLLAGLGTKLSGVIVNVPDVLTLDSLDMTFGQVMFQNEGFTLKVTGDLTLSSNAAYLQLGGIYPTNRIGSVTYFCGSSPVRLTVDGDLKVMDGARLDVRAAMTNGVEAFGAYVTVGGKMEIGANAKVCPECDPCNLGAVKFSVGSLQVDETGAFCADYRGGAGGHSASQISTLNRHTEYGYGPGFGVSCYELPAKPTSIHYGGGGGGHGGRGMFYDIKRAWSQTDPMSQKTGGKTYDNPYLPLLPGSGGGCRSTGWDRSAGHGGGVIYVEASKSIEVNGIVSANGMKAIAKADGMSGAGAGGSICLKSPTFAAGASAAISADGGSALNSAASGAGAGGRIAIWTGAVLEENSNPRRVHYNEDEPGAGWDSVTCEVVPTVSGGAASYQFPDDWPYSKAAEAGTVWFCRVDPKKGLMLILR